MNNVNVNPGFSSWDKQHPATDIDCLWDAKQVIEDAMPVADASGRKWLERVRVRLASRLFEVAKGAAIAFILTTSAGLGTAHAQQAPCVVNVNAATTQQLGYLYRTGEVLAGRIVESRPLDSVKLDSVKGVGEKWLAVNGPHVAYDGETTCTGKVKGPEKTEKTPTPTPTVPDTDPKG